MDKPTNIFYKIFQIMDHYEEVLGHYATHENKYKEDDDFFSFLYNHMKKPADTDISNNDLSNNNTKEVKNDSDKEPNTEDNNSESHEINFDDNKPTKPLTEHEEMINKYIKKCYKIIVLKCHPDKNRDRPNSNELFIKCHEYYDNHLLIGLLYVFYLYKLIPPKPIGEPCPNSEILTERILQEIRMIQDKLHQLEHINEKS